MNNYESKSYLKFKNGYLYDNQIRSNEFNSDNMFKLNSLKKYKIAQDQWYCINHQNYNYDSLIPIFDINSDFDVNHKLSDILHATTDDLFQPDFYVDTKIAENYLEDPMIPFLVNKQYNSTDHVYLAAEAVTNKNLQDRLFNLNCIHSDDYRGFYFDNLNQDTAYVAFRGTYLNFLENPFKALSEGKQAMQQWLLPIQTFEFFSPTVRNNNIEWFENECIPILLENDIKKVIVGSHSAQSETGTEITNRLSIKYPDIEFINVPINQWTTNKSPILANDHNTYHIRDPNDWISTPNVNSNLKDEYKRIKTKGSLWSSFSLDHHKLNHLLSDHIDQDKYNMNLVRLWENEQLKYQNNYLNFDKHYYQTLEGKTDRVKVIDSTMQSIKSDLDFFQDKIKNKTISKNEFINFRIQSKNYYVCSQAKKKLEKEIKQLEDDKEFNQTIEGKQELINKIDNKIEEIQEQFKNPSNCDLETLCENEEILNSLRQKLIEEIAMERQIKKIERERDILTINQLDQIFKNCEFNEKLIIKPNIDIKKNDPEFMNETDQEVISILLKGLGAATLFYTCSLLGEEFIIIVLASPSGLSISIVQGSCSPYLLTALKVMSIATITIYALEGIYYFYKKYNDEDVNYGDLIINPYILGMYNKDLVITTKEEKYNSIYNSPFDPNAELKIITNCGEAIWEPGLFEICKNSIVKWWNNIENDKNEYTAHAVLRIVLTDGYIAECYEFELDLTYLDDTDDMISQNLENKLNYAKRKFIKKYQKVWSFYKNESDKLKNKLDNDILQIQIQQTKDIYFDKLDKLIQLFNYQYDFLNLINFKIENDKIYNKYLIQNQLLFEVNSNNTKIENLIEDFNDSVRSILVPDYETGGLNVPEDAETDDLDMIDINPFDEVLISNQEENVNISIQAGLGSIVLDYGFNFIFKSLPNIFMSNINQYLYNFSNNNQDKVLNFWKNQGYEFTKINDEDDKLTVVFKHDTIFEDITMDELKIKTAEILAKYEQKNIYWSQIKNTISSDIKYKMVEAALTKTMQHNCYGYVNLISCFSNSVNNTSESNNTFVLISIFNNSLNNNCIRSDIKHNFVNFLRKMNFIDDYRKHELLQISYWDNNKLFQLFLLCNNPIFNLIAGKINLEFSDEQKEIFIILLDILNIISLFYGPRQQFYLCKWLIQEKQLFSFICQHLPRLASSLTSMLNITRMAIPTLDNKFITPLCDNINAYHSVTANLFPILNNVNFDFKDDLNKGYQVITKIFKDNSEIRSKIKEIKLLNKKLITEDGTTSKYYYLSTDSKDYQLSTNTNAFRKISYVGKTTSGLITTYKSWKLWYLIGSAILGGGIAGPVIGKAWLETVGYTMSMITFDGNFSNHIFKCKLCNEKYYSSDLGVTQDKENLKNFTFCKHCLKKYNNLIKFTGDLINKKLKEEVIFTKLYRIKELNNIYQNINHQLKLNNIVSDLSDNQVKEQIDYHLDTEEEVYLDEEEEVYLGDEEDSAEQLEEIYLGVDINEKKNYPENKENINLILKAVSNRFRINVFLISKDKIFSFENMLRYHKSIVLIKKENKYFSTDIKFNQNSTFENDLKFLKEFKVQFYQKRNNNILEKFKDFRRIFITNRE